MFITDQQNKIYLKFTVTWFLVLNPFGVNPFGTSLGTPKESKWTLKDLGNDF